MKMSIAILTSMILWYSCATHEYVKNADGKPFDFGLCWTASQPLTVVGEPCDCCLPDGMINPTIDVFLNDRTMTVTVKNDNAEILHVDLADNDGDSFYRTCEKAPCLPEDEHATYAVLSRTGVVWVYFGLDATVRIENSERPDNTYLYGGVSSVGGLSGTKCGK